MDDWLTWEAPLARAVSQSGGAILRLRRRQRRPISSRLYRHIAEDYLSRAEAELRAVEKEARRDQT